MTTRWLITGRWRTRWVDLSLVESLVEETVFDNNVVEIDGDRLVERLGKLKLVGNIFDAIMIEKIVWSTLVPSHGRLLEQLASTAVSISTGQGRDGMAGNHC